MREDKKGKTKHKVIQMIENGKDKRKKRWRGRELLIKELRCGDDKREEAEEDSADDSGWKRQEEEEVKRKGVVEERKEEERSRW